MSTDLVPDDLVLPFQIEATGVRGRIVRLGPLVQDVLTRHAYPEPVARLLGEALSLVALLGVSLKFDGTLVLQTQGDGPVGLLVANFTSPGGIRGYAQVDHEALAALGDKADGAGALLGKGHLALTIDPGGDMDRYQGIVALQGQSLSDAAHEYFQQSEQIATSIKLAVGSVATGAEPAWRAGGIMIQHLAVEGGIVDEREREARAEARQRDDLAAAQGEEAEEEWARAVALLETTEDHELLDPTVAPETLLYRLFHEDGVRVFDHHDVERVCRCSMERSRGILKSFPKEEISDMAEDGLLRVRCEFCNSEYAFDPETLEPRDTD